MRKSRYSEEQIIRVLRQVESGQKVKDVILPSVHRGCVRLPAAARLPLSTESI